MGHIDSTHWYSRWIGGDYKIPLGEMGIHAVRYEGRGYPELYSDEGYEALISEDHVKPKGWPTNLPCFGDDRDEWEITSFNNAIRVLENNILIGEIYSDGFRDGLDTAAAHRESEDA